MLEYTIDPVRAKEAVENALARLGLTKHWSVTLTTSGIEVARACRVRRPGEDSPESGSISVFLSVETLCRIDAMDAIEGGGSLDDYIERELHK
ncbi:MAG: hypothetical protein AB7I42_24200 [Bradyrhizobium sp.]|uniref:hypothetical protein n=1 Tax=Bradyrhizobium sp. TaxID=376 RepID=UPI003D0B2754